MGPKGTNVQKITTENQVQIKFPEKARAGNGTPNGDLNGGETNGHVTPDNTEIIRISGKKENCEAAAQALKALVPINIKVRGPFLISLFKTQSFYFLIWYDMMNTSSQLKQMKKNHMFPFLILKSESFSKTSHVKKFS